MATCEDCGKEHSYYGPNNEKTRFLRIELRDERVHGVESVIHYCPQCAPLGNTSIPEKLGI